MRCDPGMSAYCCSDCYPAPQYSVPRRLKRSASACGNPHVEFTAEGPQREYRHCTQAGEIYLDTQLHTVGMPACTNACVLALHGQVAAEESWQRLLLTVRQALGSGRRMLWDDAARRLAVLLTAPAAFAAEHFTQVCML